MLMFSTIQSDVPPVAQEKLCNQDNPFMSSDKIACTADSCQPTCPEFDYACKTNTSLMNETELAAYQKAYNEVYKQVQFDWYLVPAPSTSEDGALGLLCNGGWRSTDVDGLAALNISHPQCPSHANYRGLSAADRSGIDPVCTSALDASCRSPGPDIAAGGITISRARLDAFDFTSPYHTNKQVVVIRKPELMDMDITGCVFEFFLCFCQMSVRTLVHMRARVRTHAFTQARTHIHARIHRYLNIFLPFGPGLWLAIICEVFAVWLMILVVEAPINDQLAAEWEDRFYDSFYWAFGSLFDPGGPGKGPVTWGGKILLVSHWFFVTIVVATYTGAVGAFLATTSATPTIEGYYSLQGGLFGVVVTGPKWDSSAPEPQYKGTYKGGTGETEGTGYSASLSRQFEALQNTMEADTAARFNIFTTSSDSSFADDGSLVAGTNTSTPAYIQSHILYMHARMNARMHAYTLDTQMCMHTRVRAHRIPQRRLWAARCGAWVL